MEGPSAVRETTSSPNIIPRIRGTRRECLGESNAGYRIYWNNWNYASN